jgi:hypothetical protein
MHLAHEKMQYISAEDGILEAAARYAFCLPSLKLLYVAAFFNRYDFFSFQIGNERLSQQITLQIQ